MEQGESRPGVQLNTESLGYEHEALEDQGLAEDPS
jgi:hypothetical protein